MKHAVRWDDFAEGAQVRNTSQSCHELDLRLSHTHGCNVKRQKNVSATRCSVFTFGDVLSPSLPLHFSYFSPIIIFIVTTCSLERRLAESTSALQTFQLASCTHPSHMLSVGLSVIADNTSSHFVLNTCSSVLILYLDF